MASYSIYAASNARGSPSLLYIKALYIVYMMVPIFNHLVCFPFARGRPTPSSMQNFCTNLPNRHSDDNNNMHAFRSVPHSTRAHA